MISIWNIRLLSKEFFLKIHLISLIEKKVLANFLNGAISINSIFFSKIFQEKVMVIIFCFIVIYQLIINIRPTRHAKKNFKTYFCLLGSFNSIKRKLNKMWYHKVVPNSPSVQQGVARRIKISNPTATVEITDMNWGSQHSQRKWMRVNIKVTCFACNKSINRGIFTAISENILLTMICSFCWLTLSIGI